MRCFVTGVTGFLGSFLARHLLAEGHEVHAMIRRPESGGCWRIVDILSRLRVVEADLDNLHRLDESLPALRPDVIFHLAWKGMGSDARNSSAQLHNVVSTLKMLDLCNRSGCPIFVGLGSQAEYGIAEGVLDEDSACRPLTAYGATKYALSMLITKFGEITETRTIWFRLFSAYGPKDDPNHLIPHLISRLLEGTCPPLTPGGQMWDYLYVQDAVEAMLTAALCPNARGIFNLASGKTDSLRSIIELARELANPEVALRFGELSYRPDQVMHLEANICRLRMATGWEPKVSLNEGLTRTVAWSKELSSFHL